MGKDKFEECFGVDISSLKIERARERSKTILGGERIHFYVFDVDEGLLFNDSSFDVVTCIAVLEHVFNPPNVVEEILKGVETGRHLYCTSSQYCLATISNSVIVWKITENRWRLLGCRLGTLAQLHQVYSLPINYGKGI